MNIWYYRERELPIYIYIQEGTNKGESSTWKKADHFQNTHPHIQMVLDPKIDQDHTHSTVPLLLMERRRGSKGSQSITCSLPELS